MVLALSEGGFILEVIRIDVHCHLEVTVAQQGHFTHTHTHTTLFTKAWQIQNIDISVRKKKVILTTIN